jgi:glycosyltransferase involved in cell wall biosynthesis
VTDFRLAIVTISYNQARWLPALLTSIGNCREHADIEHIVVDAGSTDGSREILRAARANIQRLIMEPDAGPADGLNKGFEAATASVIGYINADDLLLPAGIAAVKKAFLSIPAPDMLLGNGLFIDDAGRTIRSFRTARHPSVRAVALGTAVVLQQATFFRRASLPWPPFNVENNIAWDTELVLSMLRRGARIGYTDSQLGAFRIHRDGITGSGLQTVKVRREHERMFREYVGASWTRLQDVEYWARRTGKAVISGAREPGRIVRKMKQGELSAWQ